MCVDYEQRSAWQHTLGQTIYGKTCKTLTIMDKIISLVLTLINRLYILKLTLVDH